MKMNNLTIKNNNNTINIRNNKLKKYPIKNRASSMDNSIANLTNLSKFSIFTH